MKYLLYLFLVLGCSKPLPQAGVADNDYNIKVFRCLNITNPVFKESCTEDSCTVSLINISYFNDDYNFYLTKDSLTKVKSLKLCSKFESKEIKGIVPKGWQQQYCSIKYYQEEEINKIQFIYNNKANCD